MRDIIRHYGEEQIQLHSDSHYSIGNNHLVCQDFALNGKAGDLHYAIVADGCSTSGDKHDVDFGARILCYAAKNAIENVIANGSLDSYNSLSGNKKVIEALVLTEIRKSANNYGLDLSVFDATLLVAIADKYQSQFFMFGDGVVVRKGMDVTHVIEMNYESNAPFYLSYKLDPIRRERYEQEFGNKKVILNYRFIDNKTGEVKDEDHDEQKYDYYKSLDSEYFPDNLMSISVMSDGIGSFYELKNEGGIVKAPISQDSVMTDILGYKSIQGSFVKRRMNKMDKNNVKNNIFHYDDISCATIALEYTGEPEIEEA